MLFPGYDARKAAQVGAFFALKEGGKINILKVAKLLYLAERESMAQYDEPMFYDKLVSMPQGPVTSITLNLINGEVSDPSWGDLLSRDDNHTVHVASECKFENLDRLSRSDLRILEELWQRFGHMTGYQLRDWTHDPKNVPEWQDPLGSSLAISHVKVFSALNKANSAELSKDINEYREIAKQFEAAE